MPLTSICDNACPARTLGGGRAVDQGRNASHRAQAQQPRDDTALIAAKLSQIEGLDRTSSLHKRRNEFLRLLEDAKAEDHSAASRKALANRLTRGATALVGNVLQALLPL